LKFLRPLQYQKSKSRQRSQKASNVIEYTYGSLNRLFTSYILGIANGLRERFASDPS
jgi:hypothetical protein